MKKQKHILVTGGAGFIGSHLADQLIKLGHSVTIFDNLSTGLKSYINPKAKFIIGDTSNSPQVKKLFENKFDVVCHIAGSASSIKSFTNAHQDVKANFLGTINIVTESIAKHVPRFLYASSMTVYGNVTTLPIKETAACKPISYYGISKYASERFVLATQDRTDLDFPFNATAFRMFNVYGPRQSLTNPYQGVMAIFIGNVLRGEPVNIFGDGRQSRDFIYIDDVVDVWIKSIDNKNTFGKAFNLGFGIDISVNDLVSTIVRTLKKNPNKYPIIYNNSRPGDQRHMRSDISGIKKILSWQPKVDLEDGLRKTIAWAIKKSLK
ncbi:MAG: NAD-dependent epimerase/dehydratase family protein [Patescibacteria group bacterium]|nr:NAD-dependent epimerase/dehydratase family protein [Patescibacteria group bacterium]MCL6096520.1 NAD-dependent epimerase/dehydratase family protein [Patescibacteria group bacterium]